MKTFHSQMIFFSILCILYPFFFQKKFLKIKNKNKKKESFRGPTQTHQPQRLI